MSARRDMPAQGVSLVNPNRRAPKLHPAGRVCSNEDCSTVLSQYNSKTECSVHEDVRPMSSQRWMD